MALPQNELDVRLKWEVYKGRLASFLEYDLRFFDEDEDRVEPAENPFRAKVLPMSPV